MDLLVTIPEKTRNVARQLRVNASGIEAALLMSAKEVSEVLERDVKRELTGTRLNVRTGALRRDVRGQARKISGAIQIGVGVTKGPATAYAEIQDQGGVIKAKPGKALPVPLKPARERAAQVKSPSELPASIRNKMFMVKPASGGSPLLGIVKGKGEFEAWYVLKKSVTIPASHWLTGPMNLHAPRVVPRLMMRALHRKLEGGAV